jgi:hypothetical protein
MILFLDFDGVLHTDPCHKEDELFRHVPLFESVMADFPDVEIVISSTWAKNRDWPIIIRPFSLDVAGRIIGKTPDHQTFERPLDFDLYHRHAEVLEWLRQAGRSGEKWVALDDRHDWFKPLLPNLVRCESSTGMTPDVASVLRRKLREN